MINCDMHIHMALDGGYWKDAFARHKETPDETWIRGVLSAYKGRGIDYLRDGGDKYLAGLKASELAEEYGITYRTPVFPICRKGRYGSFIGKAFETIDDYRALVAEVRTLGGHFIKLMVSGIMDFDTYGLLSTPPLDADEIKELVNIAHGEGFSVMVHVNGLKTIEACVAADVDSVEHGFYSDSLILKYGKAADEGPGLVCLSKLYEARERQDELFCAMGEKKIAWVPTVSTVGNLIGSGTEGHGNDATLKLIFESQKAAIKKAAARGVKIACGSDAGAANVPHAEGTLTEYKWLKEALGDETERIVAEGNELIKGKF